MDVENEVPDRVILIQMSDLHMGHAFLNTAFPRRPGWRPHDPLLCFGLTTAMADVRALYSVTDDDQLWFLMTGDLTRFGLPSEFCIGHTLLCSELICNRDQELPLVCGLNIPAERLRSIPGNHDQWNAEMWGVELPFMESIPGVRSIPVQFWPQGYNPSVEPLHFPLDQFPVTITSTGKSFRVDVFGIDSSSGFEMGERNLLARGKVSSDAASRLKKAIASTPDGDPVLRCVLCHHSLTYNAEASGTQFLYGIRPVVMDKESRQMLLDIANDKERPVHVFLTGHTHSFESKGVVTEDDSPFEMRCGTTLQAKATPGHQGFLAHEISRRQSAISWRSFGYQWDGGRFNRQETNAPWLEFQVPVEP